MKRIVGLLSTAKTINVDRRRFARIAEVGKLELVKKSDESYSTGQFFLHKVFGYRGAILFQWSSKLFDRDADTSDPKTEGDSEVEQQIMLDKKNKPLNTVQYYQVLIDSRDAPHIRAQTESVTFLGGQEGSRSIYAIPGLDYVSHDDILPYVSTEKVAIKHELFEKFLRHVPQSSPPYEAQDALKGWEKKNQSWLQFSSAHKQTTKDVRVTVMPFYMGKRRSQSNVVYWWRYCVRVENIGGSAVILRDRHWRIFSLRGTLETVKGRGVVGQEPVLTKSSPAFQYSSHVSLQSPNGHMWGTFGMERQDGFKFDVRIPPFSLESDNKEDFN